jgi:2-phospho-L-lactate transferase/gluconeogenesis factor (CofD/UPF0052 family)
MSLNVVVFAGGRGSASIISALKKYRQMNLHVLVNAYDDGLSTGEMRRFVDGMLGPSDVRKNISTLIDADTPSMTALRDLLEYRLPAGTSFEHGLQILDQFASMTPVSACSTIHQHSCLIELSIVRELARFAGNMAAHIRQSAERQLQFNFADCCFGNVIFAGCYLENRNFNLAIKTLTRLFRLRGSIVNVTDGANLCLVGLKEDGTFMPNEAAIVSKQSPSRIERVFLLKRYLDDAGLATLETLPFADKVAFLREREVIPCASPESSEALRAADIIIYGPGTQHSSLLPSYLTRGIGEIIASNTEAEKIFIGNIKKDHEIQDENAATLTSKFLAYMTRFGALDHDVDSFVTRFFFQTKSSRQGDDPDYFAFNMSEFSHPQKVVLNEWESLPGRHSGDRVVEELINIVNMRAQTKLHVFPHTVSIIVPCLNEAKTIGNTLHNLTLLDFEPYGIGKEIICIDGGSTDGSFDIATSVSGIIAVQAKQNQGRGQAIRTGIEKAKGSLIVLFPSDGEYDSKDIFLIVEQLLKNEFPIVFGSRMIKCVDLSGRIKEIYGDNKWGYFTSKYGGILLSIGSLLAFNRYVSDPLTSLKGFRSGWYQKMKFESNGVDFDMEIIAKAALSRQYILEVPVRFFPRTKAQGKKTTILDGLQALLKLFYYRAFATMQQVESTRADGSFRANLNRPIGTGKYEAQR